MPGTIKKRGNDSYQLRVCCGTDYKGKPKFYYKTVKCSSKHKAEKELAIFYANVVSGKVKRGNTQTVGQLADYWYNHHALNNLKRSSLRSVKSAIKIHIKPSFGDVRANKLKRFDIQQWIDEMALDLSPKSIRNIYSVLHTIMEYAYTFEIIDKNPCENIKLPKKKTTEASFLKKEEIFVLLNSLEELPAEQLKFKCAIEIMIFGGLRKGEVLGLDWDNVHFDDNTIKIVKTRMIGEGMGVYEDTPKTDTSIRTVPLPQSIINDLENLRLQQEELKKKLYPEWKESNAVLQGNFGRELYPQVLQRWFTSFIKKIGIPNITLKSLRHTHTSMLVDIPDIQILEISKRLGHSKTSTTMNIYAHLIENKNTIISKKLENEYLKKDSEK